MVKPDSTDQTPGPVSTTRKVDLFVVVADDDLEDHRLITDAVKDCHLNHIVTSVYNGSQLMDLLLKRGFYAVEHTRLPDLLILDLRMPVMDGVQVLREMHKHPELAGIPVFVLSDAHSAALPDDPTLHPVQAFFAKPFSYDEMKDLVGNICSLASK
jgi:two-component system, response regulator